MLNETMGHIPKDLIGREVEISINAAELFKKFKSSEPGAQYTTGARKDEEILVKAGTFYDIRIWHPKFNEELVALSINFTKFNNSKGRKIKLTPLGGGDEFIMEGEAITGKSFYSGIRMRTPEDGKPGEVRLLMPGKDISRFQEIYRNGERD